MKILKQIAESLKSLSTISENLIKINGGIDRLNKNVEDGNLTNVLRINKDGLSTSIVSKFDILESKIENNVPTYKKTEDMIKAEIQFDKDYRQRYEENPALIEFIEKYIKYEKHDIIKIYDEIKSTYTVDFVDSVKEVPGKHSK